MKFPSPDTRRFHDLLLAAIENRLADDQIDEWNALLLNDPHARRTYLHHATLHGTLHQRFSGRDQASLDADDLHSALANLFEKMSADTSAPYSPVSRSRRLFRPICAVAAALLFVALLLLSLPHLGRAPAANPAPSLSGGRALVAGLINVVWEDPALDLRLGQRLPAQRLHLHAGLLRIQLPTGTTIVLQGPAQFQLDSRSSLKLLRGNLTAHVPPAGIGFSVSTPNATVTDLGTEFGVYVNHDDETHAEVFVGNVRVSATTDTGASSSQILHAGQAVRVSDESTGIRIAPAEPLAFVRPDQFAEISAAANPAYARWYAFSRQLRHEPQLLAYYAFEPTPDNAAVLPNLADAAADHSNGLIDHATWDLGRFPGKHALRFDRGKAAVHLDIPTPLTAVSVVAWINPENLDQLRQAGLQARLDNAFAAILLSDGARESAFHWQLQDGVHTELGLGLSGSPTVLFDRYRSLDVLSSGDQGRWMFLAITVNPDDHKIHHYLDGALVGTNTLNPRDGVITIGTAEIGNWNPLTRTDHPVRGFLGRIDELAIFSRALSDQEIQSIYAAGSGG